MRGAFQRFSGQPTVETGAGMHRFVWDFSTSVGPGGRGPTALPGRYTARLTVGDQTLSRTFDVRMDPRVAEDGVTVADLQAQYDLAIAVMELMAAAGETTDEVESQIERARSAGADEALEALEAVHAELVEEEMGSYPQPMLNDQIGYLLGMISRADQPPGDFAYERFEVLSERLEEIRERLRTAVAMIAS